MIEWIIFFIKGIILTEVLTNATREWKIFDRPRNWVKGRSWFFKELLDCFTCQSVHSGFFVAAYLLWFEIPLVTFALIFHRAACFINIAWQNFDWTRANKEQDFQNKLIGGK